MDGGTVQADGRAVAHGAKLPPAGVVIVDCVPNWHVHSPSPPSGFELEAHVIVAEEMVAVVLGELFLEVMVGAALEKLLELLAEPV